MRPALRTALLAILVVAVLVGSATALASAAGQSNQPVITFVSSSPNEGATVATNSVTFSFTYNRIPKATKALTCTLAGPTSSSGACSAPTAISNGGSQSDNSFNGLSNGAYTLTVSLRLTDGGTASATRHFTVNATHHVYWTDPATGSVGRADLDGQNANPAFISGLSFPWGVAVGSGHIYWANFLSGAIERADLDGQNVNATFITGGSLPHDVAVDSGHVYWANFLAGTIGRADLDGQNVNQNFITGAVFPRGVAVDGSHVYWTNDSGTIGRADLNGQNVNQTFIAAGLPNGVAVDVGHVYWSNPNANPSLETIGRSDLDGQNVNPSFIGGASQPGAIAADSTHIYWSNIGTSTINSATVSGLNATAIIAGVPNGTGIDVG